MRVTWGYKRFAGTQKNSSIRRALMLYSRLWTSGATWNLKTVENAANLGAKPFCIIFKRLVSPFCWFFAHQRMKERRRAHVALSCLMSRLVLCVACALRLNVNKKTYCTDINLDNSARHVELRWPTIWHNHECLLRNYSRLWTANLGKLCIQG